MKTEKTNDSAAPPAPAKRVRLRKPAISRLYGRSLIAIGQEMEHLLQMARGGKLFGSDARDLARYTKLLSELVDMEKVVEEKAREKLQKMPVEELAARAKELLAKQKPKGKTK